MVEGGLTATPPSTQHHFWACSKPQSASTELKFLVLISHIVPRIFKKIHLKKALLPKTILMQIFVQKNATIFFRVPVFSHQNMIVKQRRMQNKAFSPFFIFPPLRYAFILIHSHSYKARSHIDRWCYKHNYGVVYNSQIQAHLPENLKLFFKVNTYLETVLTWPTLSTGLQNITSLWTSACRYASTL